MIEISKSPTNHKKPSVVKLNMVIILLITSLVFGFLGGVAGVYSLSHNGSLNNTTLQSLGTKTYKVTEESATIDVVKKVTPSVVSITAVSNVTDFFGQSSTQQSEGSGIILTSDGLIITNKHVASDANAKYTVLTSDGKGYPAKIVATDPLNDIALIKIDANNLTPIEIGDSDNLQVGQKVVAIGNALGFQNSVTEGIISAKERTIQASDSTGTSQETLDGMIQTDAAINPGNSGGPLINLGGQVIAINTAVASTSSAQGIGFAIPFNVAKSAIESYKKSGKIIRPYIGVRYISITQQVATDKNLSVSNGALITAGSGQSAVIAGGPADKAGLKDGDIITAINGDNIDQNHSLTRLIQNYQPGTTVQITYLRGGKSNKANVTLAEYQQ
jgi:S1-C subfamily serine protease